MQTPTTVRVPQWVLGFVFNTSMYLHLRDDCRMQKPTINAIRSRMKIILCAVQAILHVCLRKVALPSCRSRLLSHFYHKRLSTKYHKSPTNPQENTSHLCMRYVEGFHVLAYHHFEDERIVMNSTPYKGICNEAPLHQSGVKYTAYFMCM